MNKWWSENQFLFSEKKTPRFDLKVTSEEWDIIENDMNEFINSKPKNLSTFINIIIINFYEDSNASISNQLDKYESYLDIAKKKSQSDSDLYATLIQLKEDELKSRIETTKKTHIVHHNNRHTITTNTKSFEILKNSRDDIYFNSAREFVNALISEYCSLPRCKREQIYFKEKLDLVYEAINTKRVLKIKRPPTYNKLQNTFLENLEETFIPVEIVTDFSNNFTYIAGMIEQVDHSLKTVSYRLSKTNEISRHKYKNKSLSKKEKNTFYNDLKLKGPSFLSGELDKYIIRFTKGGISSLKEQVYMRPAIVEINDDIYTFECTYVQARNYFFKFEGFIEVLSPNYFREAMFKKYKAGIKQYVKEEDLELVDNLIIKNY